MGNTTLYWFSYCITFVLPMACSNSVIADKLGSDIEMDDRTNAIMRETARQYASVTHLVTHYKIRHGATGEGGHSEDVSWHVAAGAPSKGYTASQHEYGGVPIEFDPNDHCCELDGKTLRVFYNGSRYCELLEADGDEVFLLKVKKPIVFECLGWSANIAVGPKEDVCFEFATVLSRTDFRVLDPTENRFIIESKDSTERIEFIQADGKWRICSRELIHQRSQTPFLRFDYQDYRPVHGGFCMPFQIRRRQFQRPKTNGAESVTESDVLLEIESIQTDEPTVDNYRIQLQPGTLVKNRRSGEVTQIPGGLDLIDIIVDRELRFCKISLGNPRLKIVNSICQRASRDHDGIAIAGFGVAAVLIVSGLVVWVRARKRGT